jgi:hypothetical protein
MLNRMAQVPTTVSWAETPDVEELINANDRRKLARAQRDKS